MIKTNIYVHTSKEAMLELGETLGLTGEALELFKYTGCEVELGIEVNEQDGTSVIVTVDGRRVVER